MDTETPLISTRQLEIGFRARAGRSARTVASAISVHLQRGQTVCLLGPNGSGKSTLIRTLAGLHPPLDGTVNLLDRNLAQIASGERARLVSTVLTDRITIGNLSVYELISFGRSPYTGWFGSLENQDEQKVQWAIEVTGLASYIDRDVLHLSDGERQKVMIARALAQDTPAILLDEPTAHLDLPNRVEIIRLLRKLARNTGKGILLSTHELDLALKAADQLWLMDQGGKIQAGTPEDLVLSGTFESVFERDSFDFDRSTGSFTLHEPSRAPVCVQGDPVGVFWTRRALEREGYEVAESNGSAIEVEVRLSDGGYRWDLVSGDGKHQFQSMEDLLQQLRAL